MKSIANCASDCVTLNAVASDGVAFLEFLRWECLRNASG